MTGLLLTRFAASGANTPVVSYIGGVSYQDTTSPPTSHTFTAVNLGPPFPGRRIVLVVNTFIVNSGVGTITSFTLGGAAVTQRGYRATTGTNTIIGGIYDIANSTDSSADISITFNAVGTAMNIIIHVYALNSPKTTIVSGSDISSPFEFTRTFVDGDIYFGGGRCVSTATETWTNATEDSFLSIAGTTRFSCATYFPAAAGARTITFTPSNTAAALMVSVVYTT